MTSTSLAETWAAERPRLTALAYRILGDWHEAEDVVSTAWTRLHGCADVARPEAWLTTVVTRLAIDAGRSARARREHYVGPWLPEPVSDDRLPGDVAETRSLLGLGMLRLMDTLDPEARAIFVLREAFETPYAEIAACVGRSEAACRQSVRRSRVALEAHGRTGADQVRTASPADVDHRLLDALVGAVVDGDVSRVVAFLSEGCVLYPDSDGRARTARRPILGAHKVARFLVGLARHGFDAPQPVRVNGTFSLLVRGTDDYLFSVENDGERITAIQVQANPDKLVAVAPASGE